MSGTQADAAVVVAGGSRDGQALVLTGAQALTGQDIAAVLSDATDRKVSYVSPDLRSFRASLVARGLPAWRADALLELYTAIQEGRVPHLAVTTGDPAAVMGRAPRSLREFAQEVLGR